MKYNNYPNYKDSGVDWLGEIPNNWLVTKLKYTSKIYNGNSISDKDKTTYENQDKLTSLSYVSTKDINSEFFTVQYNNGLRIPNQYLVNFKVAKRNSTLVCIEGGSAGRKLALLDENVCFVNKLACIESMENQHPKYLNYMIRSYSFKYSFELVTTGLIPGVSISELKDIVTLCPPLKEQQAIANYLDKATTKMDILIKRQSRLIELLKEKREAVISSAVTHGIDSSVPMKDSGVEWLGEIPKHWKVVQSRRLFEVRKEKAKQDDEQLTASQKYGIIYQKQFMELEGRRVTQVLTGGEILKHVEANDFVISMRSFQGGLELCKYSGSVSSAYVGLIPIKHINTHYFSYLFKSKTYIQALQSTSNLVRDGQALRYENFAQVDLVIVPLEEQQNIATYIDNKTSQIDVLIDKCTQYIKLLKEKRTALISEVVTGKIDVMEAS